MPLHVAFVDLTKQGSNGCHSTWSLWISQNKEAIDATPSGLCGSHKTREQRMPLHLVFVDLTKQGSNRCHSTWPLWISQNKGATDATPSGLCGSHKTREQQMPLHVAFVDLTKQGSNRCHSKWPLWISQNMGATDATPRGFCGSHKTREQQMPLHLFFVDLIKAFDYVNREALFTILKKVGCPQVLLDFIKSFHENMQGTAQVDAMISEPFPIVNGVKQGFFLVPTLFGIYFSVILREAKQNANLANSGVGLRTRFDANLFSTSHLKAKTKTTTLRVCEALYADDPVFCSHSEEQLQYIIDCRRIVFPILAQRLTSKLLSKRLSS